EFRTLLERLEDLERTPKPKVERASLDVRSGTVEDLARLGGADGPTAVYPHLEEGLVRGLGVSPGGGQAVFVPFEKQPDAATGWLADPSRPKWVHDAKDFRAALLLEEHELQGVSFDTLLAAYLLDPAEANYPLDELGRRYLGMDVLGEVAGDTEGQLFSDPTPSVGGAAATVGLLAPVLQERIDRAGLGRLLSEVEMPLSDVLARVQAAGIRIDVDYL